MSATKTSAIVGSTLTATVGLVALAVYGGHAAVLTLSILAPLGVLTIGAGHVLAARRDRVGGLRRQFAMIALLALVQLALAVGLFVALMFVSNHDAFFAILVAVYAGGLGIYVARLLGRRTLDDVEAIRMTLEAVGDGRRDVMTGVVGTDELAALAGDVDAMIARLHDEEQARRGLIAAVSHDLRTPITSLALIAEAVNDDLFEPAAQREQLDRMTTHVRALSALIDDLFELTRLESGDIRWSVEHVALDALVQETVEAMQPHADARDVMVKAELPGTLVSAHANPEQLQRVLFNLIQNAIRHTPADGSVTVRAEPVQDGVEIEVADTGAGIGAEDRRRVFDAFFQGGDRAARTDGGAGLGLAIARAIVEAHGGRIWLEDAPVGTRVRFRLPDSAVTA